VPHELHLQEGLAGILHLKRDVVYVVHYEVQLLQSRCFCNHFGGTVDRGSWELKLHSRRRPRALFLIIAMIFYTRTGCLGPYRSTGKKNFLPVGGSDDRSVRAALKKSPSVCDAVDGHTTTG